MIGQSSSVPRPFEKLIESVPDAELRQPGSRLVESVHFDSRDVIPGACFVCRQGLRNDGHAYVSRAIDMGAIAIVAERPVSVPAHVGLALVPDGRIALAGLSRKFWGEPDLEIGTIGITGTDGKTTTSHLVAGLLKAQGSRVGSMTTVDVQFNGESRPSERRLTTPEAPWIAQQLRRMVDSGGGWGVIEVASHALELQRVHGFAFDRAVVTNVTRDHLDVHGGIAEYRRAKRRLIDLLDATAHTSWGRVAILNADDPVASGFAEHTDCDVVTFGVHRRADVRVLWHECDVARARVTVESPWGRWDVPTKLVGSWNASNIAAAVATVGSITGTLDDAMEMLPGMSAVSGRMEAIDCGQPFRVIVDFAHTPAALKAVLSELRAQTSGRIISVFGSAGDQDKGKRPLLGRVVAMYADYAVVTDEDPRGEDPELIAEAIVAGASATRPGFAMDVVLDRREAIRKALLSACPGDAVVLTGKGHETGIAYSGFTVPWNEAAEARKALVEAGYDDPNPPGRSS